jgi:GT2 family glycosyltransferase
VVPTYNRVARLRRVLDALMHQTYPADAYEVIVLNDGSTDGTDAYLAGLEPPVPFRFESQANAGPAAARNRGVELARGALILFVDDDVVADRRLVEEHVACHERHGTNTVVIGPMLTPPDHAMSPWVAWEQTMLYKQYDALEKGRYSTTSRQFYTGNASIERALLQRVGGFDIGLRRAEDIEMALRLEVVGATFVFRPEAIGYHYAERSFGSWMAIAGSYGHNDVAFARDRGRPSEIDSRCAEYRSRSALIRAVLPLAIRHPIAERAIVAGMRGVLAVNRALRIERIGRVALSAIYGVVYYQGMADELGGPEPFRRVVIDGGGAAVMLTLGRPT